MNILVVLTSHDELGETGEKTGFWLEEFVAPYYVFRDAGARVTLASPAGGSPPVDPRSLEPDAQTESTRRFAADDEAQAALAATVPLAEIEPEVYDALFYPGGHGPLWDLAEHPCSIALIESAHAAGKALGAVCHGPAVLRHARGPDGEPLVRGRAVTGFSDSEEAAVGLTGVVPFSVESVLRENGGRYKKAGDFAAHVEVGGRLVTGQNPASSEAAARALIDLLTAQRPAG